MSENLNYILVTIAGIVAGFIAGAGVARHQAEKKYEPMIHELHKKTVDLNSDIQDGAAKIDNLQARINELSKKDEDFAEYMAERVGPEDDIPAGEPIVISEMDYQFKYPECENESLEYYVDGVLTGEDGAVKYAQSDILEMLGEEGMLAAENGYDDVVYIHNDALHKNYEVRIMETDYYDWSPDEEEDS